MSNCSRRMRGDKREEDHYPTITYPSNNCFLPYHHLPNQYNTRSHTSITLLHMPSIPFLNSNATFPSSSTLQSHPAISGPHNSAHIFQFPLAISLKNVVTTLQEMSHILPYSAITSLSPLTILHLFLSTNNPAEPVLSLTLLTLYRPQYLSTPVSSFCQPIPLQCAFHCFFFPVLLICCLNLVLQLTNQPCLVIRFNRSPQKLILFPPTYSSVLS